MKTRRRLLSGPVASAPGSDYRPVASAPGSDYRPVASAPGSDRRPRASVWGSDRGPVAYAWGSDRGTALLWLVLLLLPAGCGGESTFELRRQITKLQEGLEEKNAEIDNQRLTIEKLHEQLAVVRALPLDFRDKVFYPEKIEIANLSGGDDYDGKPGDDGVTVYLRPLDRDGDALKVAGDVRIELYDLQNPPGENLIGEYFIPADQIAEHWYGKLATYHYTIRCPWQKGPPAHDEITIRVTFVDFLSQRVMTAQTVCTVRLPP